MKLEPRTRRKAALMELEPDSNYLLLFRNTKNAHLYTRRGGVRRNKPQRRIAQKATKAQTPRAKKTKGPQRFHKVVISPVQSQAVSPQEFHQRQDCAPKLDASAVCNETSQDPWRYDVFSPTVSVPIELLPTLVQMANSEDEKEMLQGVMLIRKLLSVGSQANVPIQAVVDSGVCPRLVQCMQHSNFELQHEASWALCNIASGNTTQSRYVMDLNVVPLWVQHLSNPSIKCVEQATWGIGNIAADGAKCRDHALEMGAMPPLLNIVVKSYASNYVSLLKSAVWALSNLCRCNPQPALDYVAPAVPILVNLVRHFDTEVALDAFHALSCICDGPQNRVRLVIDSGVVPLVVDLLDAENSPKFHLYAMRIIGNLCAGDDTQTQIAIDAGCLPRICKFLANGIHRQVRCEALWTVSNIAAGNTSQIQALMKCDGLLRNLVATVGAVEAVEVKKEAVWACAIIASSGTSGQIGFMVECGVLEAFCQVLATSTDAEILIKALEAIRDVIQHGARLFVRLATHPTNTYVDRIRSFQGERSMLNLSSHADHNIRALVQSIGTVHFES